MKISGSFVWLATSSLVFADNNWLTIDSQYFEANYIARSIKSDERSGEFTLNGGEALTKIYFTDYFFIPMSYRQLNGDFEQKLNINGVQVDDTRLLALTLGAGIRFDLIEKYLGIQASAEALGTKSEYLNGSGEDREELNSRFDIGFFGDITEKFAWQLDYRDGDYYLYEESDASLKMIYHGVEDVNLVLGYSHKIGDDESNEETYQWSIGFSLTF